MILLDKKCPYDTIDTKDDVGPRAEGGEEVATINLRDIPDELHRALRIRAAELGTNVKALVIRYCQEGLERDKKTKKKRG